MLVTAQNITRCRQGTRSLAGLLWGVTTRRSCLAVQSSRRAFGSLSSRRRYHGEARSFQDSDIHNIRNIGIIAHVDAGKTTTTERMLYYSGATRTLGNVDDGNTVTDFLPAERERGITIQSAAITLQWPPRNSLMPGETQRILNLIDTPGHQDFSFEVERSMPELDGAVCILDATKGVETNTEKVYKSSRQYDVPTIFYVNKHDLEGASFRKSVHDIASILGTFPLVCQIPWWDNEVFVGHIDVINERGMKYSSTGIISNVGKNSLPVAVRDELDTARSQLIDIIAENDDPLMEEFSEHGKVSVQSIKAAIRRLTIHGHGKFSPVFCGSSRQNVGVQPLMDAVVDYLPSPAERPDLKVLVGKQTLSFLKVLGREAPKKPNSVHRSSLSAVAHVFKVVDDPQRGMTSYVRVHHGTLSKAELWNTREHKFERPLNILQIFADKTHDITHLSKGHIGALTGLKTAQTGDTLLLFAGKTASASLQNIQIRPPEVPPAVAFISMEPFSRTSAEKLEDALARLSRVDPSIRYHLDEKTEQLIVSGLGLLHLEIARDRLETFYKIKREDVLIGNIQVEYRETLLAPAQAHRETYERVIGGKAGKAGCTVEIQPFEDHDHELLLESCIEKDGNMIDIFITPPEDPRATASNLPFDPEAVRQQLLNGITAALARGPRRGSRMRRCLVKLTFDPATDFYGASTTGGHIQEAALHGVRNLLRDAHANGGLGVLEPLMKVRITVPESAAGDIQHDLTSRRGGQVVEVRSLADEAYSASPDASSPEVDAASAGSIDMSQVYAPPDPYESIHSLRDSKKGRMRMAEIVARVPLREMLQYDAQLRQLTSGRNHLSMEADGFELVTGPRLKAIENMG